jgi:SAM-dependent methyltransferase
MSSSYVIAGGHVGRERLRVLARVMAPTTSALLARVGIPPDARCLDVGCGGGDVSVVLAALVPDGSVVGVDFDPVKIAAARAESAALGIANVEYREADLAAVTSGHERFDVIYVRFVLSHLTDPADALRALVGRLAPGGVVVTEDIDIDGALCWPPSPAFDRARELYSAAVRSRGADPQLGLRLPGLLLDAGLVDVGVGVVQPAALHGDPKRIQLLTLETTADSLVGAGLATPDEIAGITAELAAYVDRPDTLASTARVIQAWGRARG